jgi:hypothetical protein
MRTILTLCLALACLAGLARADVLVVDATVAPGHYATIQDAIDAAVVGDTVLVDHTYNTSQQTVVIDGKGISLLADAFDERFAVKHLTVRNVPAGQRATLRGINAVKPVGVAMTFTDNAGTLRLYSLGGEGTAGIPQTATQAPRDGSTGAVFSNCADVMLRYGGFKGGDGGVIEDASDLATTDGGVGALVTNSKISAFFTAFTGGDGGHVEPVLSTIDGGTGGTGMVNDGSTVFHYGSSAGGGPGGDTHLVPGGAGGTGYEQSGAGASLSTYLTGPAGGLGGEASTSTDGPTGVNEVISTGTTTELSKTVSFARDMWMNTPLREGEEIKVTVTGFEENVWAFFSLSTGNQLFPQYQGALMLGSPFLTDLVFLGYVPFIAIITPLGNAPELPVGIDTLEVQVQTVVNVNGSGFSFAMPDHIVLLDADF